MLRNQSGNNKPRSRILTVLPTAEQDERSSVKISLRGKGISIIEILVVIAILAVTLTSLLGLINFTLGAVALTNQNVRANALAQEAMEATRSIRDNSGWNQMINGNHGLTNIAGYWGFSGTENLINNFTRIISIADAQRDASDNIVESGGSIDLDTKKITVVVSWEEKGRPHNIELVTYLTNWQQ